MALVEGLNRLEATERAGGSDELWHSVRSILGGLLPEIHWASREPPSLPSTTLLHGVITTPDPQWTASMFNQLVRRSGVQLAAQVVGSKVVPFVHLPDRSASVAWALWWAFRERELERLRRCVACNRWFRDATKPKNQTHCSVRCTRRMTMRAYRAALRRKRRSRKAKKGRK